MRMLESVRSSVKVCEVGHVGEIDDNEISEADMMSDESMKLMNDDEL